MNLFKNKLFWKAILIPTAFFAGYLAATFGKPDNIVEETAEKVLKDQTGVEIDFSEN